MNQVFASREPQFNEDDDDVAARSEEESLGSEDGDEIYDPLNDYIQVIPSYGNLSNKLGNLTKALADPSANFIIIKGCSIRTVEARAIRDLMLSPNRKSAWRLRLIGCYPENDEAKGFLKEAFSAPIDSLRLESIHSTNVDHRRMLECVFSAADRADRSVREMEIKSSTLDVSLIFIMKEWAHHVHVEAYDIESTMIGDTNLGPVAFFAAVYEGLPRKPKSLVVICPDYQGDVDVSKLKSWDGLENLWIEFFEGISFSGLSSLPLSLRSLSIGCDPVSMSNAGDLIDFLHRDDCELTSLYLMSAEIEFAFFSSLCDAMKTNRTINYFEIQDTSINRAKAECLAALFERNASIKSFFLRTSAMLASSFLTERLVEVLSSLNTSLQEIGYGGEDDVNHRVIPLAFRNRAGRCLLEDQHGITAGLWPVIFARIGRLESSERLSLYVNESNSIFARLRQDSTYHLLRGCAGVVFGSHSSG